MENKIQTAAPSKTQFYDIQKEYERLALEHTLLAQGVALSKLSAPLLDEALQSQPLRFPVHYVIKADDVKHRFSGYVGRIAAGTLRVGDAVLVLPSNRPSTVKSITDGVQEIDEASALQLVAITLEGDVEVTRGDMIVKINEKYPRYSSAIDLNLTWLRNEDFDFNRKYLLQHITDETEVLIKSIKQHDPESILVSVKALKPLKFDPYDENKTTGSVLVVDPKSRETLGIGIITVAPEVYSYNI